MTRQNRVTPFGKIVALPLRGQFMGNRGILHDARGEIIRPYQSKAWIICVLAFRETPASDAAGPLHPTFLLR
ncbi:MAG: hypothetical protein R3E31_23410 [Chloroflexota bacterium]